MQIILHLEYHENDIPRRKVRTIFMETLGHLLERKVSEGGIGMERAIVAYSRPRNLRDLLQSAKVHVAPGAEVSTYFLGASV